MIYNGRPCYNKTISTGNCPLSQCWTLEQLMDAIFSTVYIPGDLGDIVVLFIVKIKFD